MPRNARAGATWNTDCTRVGVIRISTTIAAVSIQVISIDSSTPGRCRSNTRRSGKPAASSLRACIASNTGVSLSQRRSHTAKKPNTPPARNGSRQP